MNGPTKGHAWIQLFHFSYDRTKAAKPTTRFSGFGRPLGHHALSAERWAPRRTGLRMTSAVHFYYPLAVRDRATGVGHTPASTGLPGNYVWTVKTHAQLSSIDFPCRLAETLPDEGIIVTHREFLPNSLVPNPNQLFVCIVADHSRHPFAQLHVVQNPRDPMLVRFSRSWPAGFVPHWTESALIPRDPDRGNRFENVTYFGLPARLAPQVRSDRFDELLRRHGFNFRIARKDRWNDYGDTDAVLAVRSFAALSFHKYPPSKLYNSWLARVPALLGSESAYQAERRSELDYVEVRSSDDILSALERLRSDEALRAAMTRNGIERAAHIEPACIAQRWADFLSHVAVPAYHHWRQLPVAQRRAFLSMRPLHYARFTAVDLGARSVDFVRKEWVARLAA